MGNVGQINRCTHENKYYKTIDVYLNRFAIECTKQLRPLTGKFHAKKSNGGQNRY